MTRRVGARWLTAGAVALSLMAAAAPAQASTRATSHLRSAAVPATVLIGASTVVSGAVSPSVAGSPVVLQKLVAGHWKTLGHEATGKGGTYSFKVHATGKVSTWSLRVTRAATSKATAVVGKTLKVHLTKTAYKVSAAAVTKVNYGTPVVISGKVTPKTTGLVILQVLNAGKWHTLATGRLTASAYTFSKKLPAKTYPLRVVKPYNATIAQGESKAIKVTVFPTPGTTNRPPVSPRLTLTSPDDAVLGLPGNRLVFSTAKALASPTKSFTFTNSGNAAATVSGLAIQGPDATSFALVPGQATTFVVPAGGSVTVGVDFKPTVTTNCPTGTTYPDAYKIGNSTRVAALVFTTSDVGLPGGNATLAGVNACDYSGNNEPVLDQVLSTLGYTDVVTGPKTDRRYIGKNSSGPIPGTDEISAPYFTVADPTAPVSVVPLAHYSTTSTKPYQATGWYAKGAVLGADGTCNDSCHQAWSFPGEASATSFLQNQKLLPVPVGTTTFTPTGTFGLYNGESTNVNFSDDKLNVAHQCVADPSNPANTCYKDNQDIVPTQYLHNLRIYPAYGLGHVAIPHTYLVAIDVSRLADKNDDFQDIVLLVRNVTPAS